MRTLLRPLLAGASPSGGNQPDDDTSAIRLTADKAPLLLEMEKTLCSFTNVSGRWLAPGQEANNEGAAVAACYYALGHERRAAPIETTRIRHIPLTIHLLIHQKARARERSN